MRQTISVAGKKLVRKWVPGASPVSGQRGVVEWVLGVQGPYPDLAIRMQEKTVRERHGDMGIVVVILAKKKQIARFE